MIAQKLELDRCTWIPAQLSSEPVSSSVKRGWQFYLSQGFYGDSIANHLEGCLVQVSFITVQKKIQWGSDVCLRAPECTKPPEEAL